MNVTKLSAGSSDVGEPLCLYDQNSAPIALMNTKLPFNERASVALEICERFNKRTIETFTEYEGKCVKVTTYWDETIPNDLNDAPGALVTKIEPANSVST